MPPVGGPTDGASFSRAHVRAAQEAFVAVTEQDGPPRSVDAMPSGATRQTLPTPGDAAATPRDVAHVTTPTCFVQGYSAAGIAPYKGSIDPL